MVSDGSGEDAPRVVRGDELPDIPALRLSYSDEIHVLWGDDKGGGHFWNVGNPGKHEFPERWDEQRIVAEIELTIASPQFSRLHEAEARCSLYRITDEVLIYVALARSPDGSGSWRFTTSFPLNGRGVVLNNPRTGRRELLDLEVLAWERYPG